MFNIIYRQGFLGVRQPFKGVLEYISEKFTGLLWEEVIPCNTNDIGVVDKKCMLILTLRSSVLPNIAEGIDNVEKILKSPKCISYEQNYKKQNFDIEPAISYISQKDRDHFNKLCTELAGPDISWYIVLFESRAVSEISTTLRDLARHRWNDACYETDFHKSVDALKIETDGLFECVKEFPI